MSFGLAPLSTEPLSGLPQATGSSGISGSLSSVEGADTLVASGTIVTTGSASAIEGADSLSAVGSVSVSGSMASTEGADTLAASGATSISGTLADAEGADTLAASGTVSLAGITGTLARTEGADVLAAQGDSAAQGPGGYPSFCVATIMRESIENVQGGTLHSSAALSAGTMVAILTKTTIMRAQATSRTAAITSASINLTAALL